MSETEVTKLERLLDEVEELVEAGREILRKKASAKVQEEIFRELAGETRELMAVLEPEERLPPPAPQAPPKLQLLRKKRLPGRLLTEIEASRLSEIRASKGLSKSAVAEKIGISGPGYTNIENRRTAGSPEILERIWKLFGLPASP